MDRLSDSYKNAVDMQTRVDLNTGKIKYTKNSPDIIGLRLGTMSERDIVEWLNYWDESLAEYPTYAFNFVSDEQYTQFTFRFVDALVNPIYIQDPRKLILMLVKSKEE